ncbi:PH domain-like protein [Acephala macrosclerotiorum]|nr:PH domain-like protein [Acephala macrosclerotiorum]
MPPRGSFSRTPRKTRQRGQTSSSSHAQPAPIPTSDYDSEAFYHDPAPTRTREEINDTVIRRYVPSLQSIVAIAPNAVIYTFAPETETWDKANIEGSMFVCQLTPSQVTGGARHCIIVLNRKGMENLIIESGEIEVVEITEQFLILAFQSHGERKTLGIYLHGSEHYPRDYVCQLVKAHWETAMEERTEVGSEEYDEEVLQSIEAPAENRPMGRRISLSELFGRPEQTEDEGEYYHH